MMSWHEEEPKLDKNAFEDYLKKNKMEYLGESKGSNGYVYFKCSMHDRKRVSKKAFRKKLKNNKNPCGQCSRMKYTKKDIKEQAKKRKCILAHFQNNFNQNTLLTLKKIGINKTIQMQVRNFMKNNQTIEFRDNDEDRLLEKGKLEIMKRKKNNSLSSFLCKKCNKEFKKHKHSVFKSLRSGNNPCPTCKKTTRDNEILKLIPNGWKLSKKCTTVRQPAKIKIICNRCNGTQDVRVNTLKEKRKKNRKIKIECGGCKNIERLKKLKDAAKKVGLIIHRESLETYKNERNDVEYTCKNGHVSHTKAYNIINGVGCNKCHGYKNEELTRKVLNKYFGCDLKKKNIGQKELKEAKIKTLLRRIEFDGIDYNEKIAFEYNGEQHYKKIKKFNKNPNEANRSEKEKKEYCNKNQIKLIFIKYYVDNKILTICKNIKDAFKESKIEYNENKLIESIRTSQDIA